MTAGMHSVRTLVVATDFSPSAERALEWAADLSQRYAAPLTIAHVIQPLVSYAPDAGSYLPAGFDERLRADARAQLARAQRRAEALGAQAVSVRLLEGHPGSEVVELARQSGADALVVGTHGRTGVKHLLLGSVAEWVVRHAGCPVLVARSAQAESNR